MNECELLRRVGNMEQLAYVRETELTSGKGRGTRALFVNNGVLSFTVLPDRGFDIADMRYKNINLSFMTKNGIVGAHIAHTDAVGFASSFTGGFLYTCGFDNIGGGENGLVTHGSETVVPASVVNIEKEWKDGQYVISVSGIMENTALFAQNLVLKRTLTTTCMSNTLHIKDTLINRGFTDVEYKMLYHFNFGYPLVDEGAKIVADIESTVPRTEAANKGRKDMLTVDAPIDVTSELVFFHKIRGERPTVTLKNPSLKLAANISYDRKNLPEFVEWKSPASGDYAIGLEPCTTTVEDKKPSLLTPGKNIVNELSFSVDEII